MRRCRVVAGTRSVAVDVRKAVERSESYGRLAEWAESTGKPGLASVYRARAAREVSS